ncbi:MAG TPA: adenylate/guanylate cyclase domain-containing protein [Nitrososphaeraceae archaeon]
MYNSGILPDIIAMQLDISKDKVYRVIKNEVREEERKKASVKEVSDASSLGMFNLDTVISIELAIKHAQHSMWKALKGAVPEFNISMVEETQDILERYAESKVTFVILHIDVVGSTKMSMTLPVERLVTIIQTFTQEMSLIIAAYGGYVLKYVGDAVFAFFPVSSNDLYLPCINAVNCARSMIKIMREGMNPILNEYDYPEMGVRVGVDLGENVVVQYGWDAHAYTIEKKNKQQQIVKKPHLDILGYTISITAKMTAFAKYNQIVIGQYVYDTLDDLQKSTFKVLQVRSNDWNYVSSNTGDIYRLYGSTIKKE